MSIKLSSPESVGMCSSRLSRIGHVMQEQIQQGSYAGISTLIARRGKVVHFEQWGERDREAKLPMQADTLFRFYSMTKPIVCTAFMTLYEQGKVDLYEPVAKYIPAFANLKVQQLDANGKEALVPLEKPVQIFHLLTHTSGLAYDFYDDHPVCELYRQQNLNSIVKDVSLEDFVAKLCQLPLLFQPGARWYYSVSIDVVGRLIEIIAGKPLDQFLQETLFAPLGMDDMAFCLTEKKQSRLAAIYGAMDLCEVNAGWTQLMQAWESGTNKRLDVTRSHPMNDPNFRRGGLGLMGSAQDYYRFAQMLLNKGTLNGTRILSPKTLELMHMNHLSANMVPIYFQDITIPGYGFGLGSRVLLNVADTELAGTVGEYGWAGAATTYYWIDPKEELIGIFLTQQLCNFSLIERAFQTLAYQAVVE